MLFWTRKNMRQRKRNFIQQNENDHDDWANVEWHKPLTKTMNSSKLSHNPSRASQPCRQINNFWLWFVPCLSNVRKFQTFSLQTSHSMFLVDLYNHRVGHKMSQVPLGLRLSYIDRKYTVLYNTGHFVCTQHFPLDNERIETCGNIFLKKN